jgi:hypothetical protein
MSVLERTDTITARRNRIDETEGMREKDGDMNDKSMEISHEDTEIPAVSQLTRMHTRSTVV